MAEREREGQRLTNDVEAMDIDRFVGRAYQEEGSATVAELDRLGRSLQSALPTDGSPKDVRRWHAFGRLLAGRAEMCRAYHEAPGENPSRQERKEAETRVGPHVARALNEYRLGLKDALPGSLSGSLLDQVAGDRVVCRRFLPNDPALKEVKDLLDRHRKAVGP